MGVGVKPVAFAPTPPIVPLPFEPARLSSNTLTSSGGDEVPSSSQVAIEPPAPAVVVAPSAGVTGALTPAPYDQASDSPGITIPAGVAIGTGPRTALPVGSGFWSL